jgi:hypothetical protein
MMLPLFGQPTTKEGTMADEIRQLELAALRAEFTAFRARVEAQERQRRRAQTARRRLFPTLLAVLLVALTPLALLAANPFLDLNPGSVHNPNIEAIYDAGITTGCDPGIAYCPNDFVTRQEMASFLARTAGLGANLPTANAKTLQGYAPPGLARVARAIGANRVDTMPTNALPVTAMYPASQTVVTVALTAPGAGFVLVNGAMLVAASTGVSAIVSLRDPIGGEASPLLYVNTSAPAGHTGALSPTYLFPVTAGERIFTLEASKGSAAAVSVADATLTALFIPFGPTGGSTLDTP